MAIQVREQLHDLKVQAEKWSAEEVLRWAFKTYPNKIGMASGFGVEGMVLIDIASRTTKNLEVFTLDTEFLFPETYALIDRVERRYGIQVERLYAELTPEEQERTYGPALWSKTPDQCCNMRKVEPLRKKLASLDAWIAAIRRDQSSARADAGKIQWDNKFQLVKVNPLADWTKQDIWNYVFKHDVPYNPLHDQNYPSIGCTHCTRAVQPGEDSRAGRWAGFSKTECGLHLETPEVAAPLVQIGAAGGND
ncbi:MAG TPA: phosphoadenylyl-sulfate reductase [Terriglobales bacterium]|nr:phosphoadenylyl-sulfate reductase [Terriglobales bacterium]